MHRITFWSIIQQIKEILFALGERVVDENPKTEFGAVNKESITDVLASDETVSCNLHKHC